MSVTRAYISLQSKGGDMLDNQFKIISTKVDLEEYRIINRMQYIMNYGEYTVCYDFFLN